MFVLILKDTPLPLKTRPFLCGLLVRYLPFYLSSRWLSNQHIWNSLVLSGEGCSAFPAFLQWYEWDVDHTLNIFMLKVLFNKKLSNRKNFLSFYSHVTRKLTYQRKRSCPFCLVTKCYFNKVFCLDKLHCVLKQILKEVDK